MTQQRGFSVAELLATFTLLTMITATVVPSLSKVSHSYQLRTATHELYSELQWLRSQAVMANSRHRLSLSGSGQISYSRFDAGTTTWVALDRTPPSTLDLATVSGPATVVFLPNGATSAAASFDVANAPGQPTKHVSVSVAGSVRITS